MAMISCEINLTYLAKYLLFYQLPIFVLSLNSMIAMNKKKVKVLTKRISRKICAFWPGDSLVSDFVKYSGLFHFTLP